MLNHSRDIDQCDQAQEPLGLPSPIRATINIRNDVVAAASCEPDLLFRIIEVERALPFLRGMSMRYPLSKPHQGSWTTWILGIMKFTKKGRCTWATNRRK
ncbi:uncharacterized protein Dwil_GK27684 [Drosophila willistoni]|uniref:Uncharacterized protein n=1 Tax=Drosophila willistoni TaxID=7260 RepID=A0A0Q9X6G5_DROWI|nr:uncharacterized protein Dwil_GK27684 [Drosophila willistoni]